METLGKEFDELHSMFDSDMVIIGDEHVLAAKNARTPDELAKVLQKALELEYSTIPPYLTAWWSIKVDETAPGQPNKDAQKIMETLAMEEMLHMAAVSNIIRALGKTSDLRTNCPSYPCTLPMLDIKVGWKINLEPFSESSLKEVYMRIEQPVHPVPYPDNLEDECPDPKPKYIGDFYEAIINNIRDNFSDCDFSHCDTRVQYEGGNRKLHRPPGTSILVSDKKTAIAALNFIVDQGEGNSKTPMTDNGEPAHFYRLAQIMKKRKLVPNPDSPLKFSYSGEEIVTDYGNVHQFPKNDKYSNYDDQNDPRREKRDAIQSFNNQYKQMVQDLQNRLNIDKNATKSEICSANTDMQISMFSLYQESINCFRSGVGIPFELDASGTSSIQA